MGDVGTLSNHGDGQATVSAILPTYNAEATVGAVLGCVFDAAIPGLEVVVVDDASTDNTVAVCREYPVRLIEEPVNRGAAYCRNKAIRAASADILLLLDSDILFAPALLSRMLACMEASSHWAGVYTLTAPEPLNPGFAARYFALQEYLRFMDVIARGRQSWAFISTRCGLMRRDVFEETGGFNELLPSAAYEDLEFSSRMDSRHQFALNSTFLVRHYWPESIWRILRRLHVNARGVIAFAPEVRKKASEPFIRDRNARMLLLLSWLFMVLGIVWWPMLAPGFLCHLGAMQQASWLLKGCRTHENGWFAFKAWGVFNLTLIPFGTGVIAGKMNDLKLKRRRTGT